MISDFKIYPPNLSIIVIQPLKFLQKITGAAVADCPGRYHLSAMAILFAGSLEFLGFLAGLALVQVVHDRSTYEYG